MSAWELFCALHFEHLVVLGHKCSDDGCVEVATWLCFWPGQHRPKCDAHRNGWSRIANAMGFDLVSTPLTVRNVEEPDPISQRAALLELT